MTEPLTKLVARRGQIKGHLSRFASWINEANNYSNGIQISDRLGKVEQLFDQFDNVQSQIELLDDSESQLIERDEFETKYFEYTAKAKTLLCQITPSHLNKVSLDTQSTMEENKQLNIRLPEISLPTFSGGYDQWPKFSETFTSLIHNKTNLTVTDKYFYLQGSLKGEAAQVIESLEVCEANYTVAWELLKNRFENKKLIIKNHVKAVFELQNVIKDSFSSLRGFLDTFQKHYRVLLNVSNSQSLGDSIILHLLLSKLDVATKKEWETKTNSELSPSVEQFLKFISDKCQLLETIDTKSIHSNLSHKGKSLVCVSTKANNTCVICKENHQVYHCKKFLQLSISSRIDEARKSKICTNCLRQGHFVQDCKSGSCRHCHKKHNTLLHLPKEMNQRPKELTNSHQVSSPHDKSSGSSDNNETFEQSSLNHSVNTPQHSNQIVLLSTALLYIYDSNNQPILCRGLIDNGSQSNFMNVNLHQKLGLNSTTINVPLCGINGTTSAVNTCTTATIKSRTCNFQKTLSFLIINKITEKIPQCSFDSSILNIPVGLTLADPSFEESGDIDILLGASIFYNLLSQGQIFIGNNLPILTNSKLGWLIGGPLPNVKQLQNSYCNLSISQELNLEKQLLAFWQVEECYNDEKGYSNEERDCEEHFVNNFQREYDGRFTVKLPLREEYELGDTCQTALKRFYSLEHKLAKNPTLKLQYETFMNEYIQLGHMSKIDPDTDQNQLSCYLPHHAVIKESSQTTKLRVVFDASAISENGRSLNSILKTGPNIQDDIFSIILRFRLHNVVFTADICKMYRQINVHSEHRDLQRILWRNDSSKPLDHYRLNTVTYGTAPASFLATRCLKQLSIENQDDYPIASKSIGQDFYMDDWITGTDNQENAIKLIHEVDQILKSAGFELRQWTSNDPQLLGNLTSNGSIASPFQIKDSQGAKTLGVSWDSASDQFQYSTSVKNCSYFTKRSVLSIISQIFDPLGVIGPVTTKAKLFLQKLWQLKLDWDDPIPKDLLSSWNQYFQSIHSLNDISIPRHIVLKNSKQIQIHAFSDASQTSYGACIYLRSQDTDGNIFVSLACAKSRVAPIKSITIPRLELCGALLAAQLCYKVTKAFNSKFDQIHFWCDSTIVLSWIASEANNLKTFVANRVSLIQNLTKIEQWHYVSTETNPADVISRGLNPNQIKDLQIWWNGPEWLSTDSTLWPKQTSYSTENVLERKNKSITLPCQTQINDIFTRFSSLNKLLRVVAYIIRFKNNLLNKDKSTRILTNQLSVEEVDNATSFLVKVMQHNQFQAELVALKQTGSVSNKSNLLSLNPFLDENEIIRVGGRLENSQLPYNTKHPIIIPSKHPFTTLVIRHQHHKDLHAGTQTLLSNIRTKYWPLRGKQTVRNILNKCITCFRAKPSNTTYKMGNLPAVRVTPTFPFSVSGVDFAGPYLIKTSPIRNRSFSKCYICVFICFMSKAVHLELVLDLSTEGFLNAFKRFVSRRGLCYQIYSDNATNFVGADNLLKGMEYYTNDSKFQNFLLDNRVKWNFIPPRSPHFGGLWEAAVKLTKYHVKRVIGDLRLTHDQFHTFLSQVESIVNSRPMFPLTENIDDLEPLTPSHFLIGRSMLATPETDVPDTVSTHVSRYKHTQLLFQQFWSRWSKDYLHSLQQRPKWKVDQEKVSVGSLVILHEDNTPPLYWKMGRIAAVHPGNDGTIRVVTVKTSSGLFKRSVVKISVLPIETSSVSN